VRVSDNVVPWSSHWDLICSLFSSFLRKVLRCCLSRVVLRYLMLEVTLSVWSYPRVEYSELISLRVRVCRGVSWLVLQVSCGSGIKGWVT
jgi:hypothetical protein